MDKKTFNKRLETTEIKVKGWDKIDTSLSVILFILQLGILHEDFDFLFEAYYLLQRLHSQELKGGVNV